MKRRLGFALAATSLFSCPSPALPQPADADSVSLHRHARSEQSRFEWLRGRHLPWTWNRGGGRCDERIGRFCLWHDSGAEAWQPPPEPEPVGEGRERLIAVLDSVSARLPGDHWVMGQLVWYLLEAGRPEDARAATDHCRAARAWWCTALLGLARHAAGDFAAAERAFEAALPVLSASQRERWTDVTPLLDRELHSEYHRSRGVARARFERRFWWLADPLYLIPGNERRSEHFSRWVINGIQQRARTPEPVSWGDDLRELLIRYGWPVGWERVRESGPSLSTGRPGVVSHYADGGRTFAPPAAVFREPFATGPAEWQLDPDEARSAYAPVYTDSVLPLEHQLARFRRGDSLLVVAAYRLEGEVSAEAELGLFLFPAGDRSPVVARARSSAPKGALTARVPLGPTLLSLEALDAPRRYAARVRHGLAPGAEGISDLLVLGTGATLPGDLTAAVQSVRAPASVPAGDPIRLYWEVYGGSGDTASVLVSVHRTDPPGLARRVGEWLGIVSPAVPDRLRWREVIDGEIAPRSLSIDFPDAKPGRYRVRVEVHLPGREPVSAAREVTIAPAGGG
ncbi:MAG: hypothetical protein ACREKN_06280 [Longimicrobiaceae bacterium]